MITAVQDLIPEDENNRYRYELLNDDGTGSGMHVRLKYAPGELISEPTVVDRELFMKLQGFAPCKTAFNSDGSITECGDTGTRVTEFLADGSIKEAFTDTTGKKIVKITTFNNDNNITEVIE